MDIIRELEKEQLKSEVTPFNVGDTVRVYAKVVEGNRERLQMFDKELYLAVKQVLDENKAERHLRGGMATRKKYRGEEK